MSIMQLPYTNLHEINLDWIIEKVKEATDIAENVYSPENPPPYPVRTVNGQTGDVTIIIPVNSVNGKTGSVVTPFINPGDAIQRIDTQSPNEEAGIQRVLNGSGIVTLRVTHTGNMPEAYIRYSLPNGQNQEYRLVTLADIPESSGVVSVNGKTGVVVINGANLVVSNTDNRTIAFAINAAEQQLADQLDRILVNEDDINYIERGTAILATDNTHAAITTGQFVFIKSHPTLTPGIYVATANIATNEALTSNNLSTVPNGGLNALKTNINTLNSNLNNLNNALYKTFGNLTTDGITFSNCSLIRGGYCKIANMVVVEMRVKITQAVEKWGTILTEMPYAGYDNSGYHEIPLTAYKYNSPQSVIMLDVYNNAIRSVSDNTLAVDDEIAITGVYLSN